VHSRTKNFIVGFLKYAIGIAALAYVVTSNWGPKGKNPGISGLLQQTPNYSLVVPILLLAVAILACQILRWYVLIRALDLPCTVRNAYRVGLVGYFYNMALPGSIGGDLVKAYFLAQDHPERRPTAVATVVADRFLGLFGLLWFAAVLGGGAWLLGDERIAQNAYLTKTIITCGVLTFAIVVGWIIIGIIPEKNGDAFLAKLRTVKLIGPTLAELGSVVSLYRKNAKAIYLTIPLTAFAQLLMMLFLHFSVRLFPGNDAATLAEHFVIGPVGFIGQAFFPAPGGVGGGEAIFGYLYTLIGRDEASGAIARLTMRVADIGLGAVGYIVYLTMKKELPATEAAPVAITP
jgi:glycosyltransferase 2 family protein